MTSATFLSTMGAPICTEEPAVSRVAPSIVMEEKVAPRMPSRPVLPPSATILSPTRGSEKKAPLGAMPAQPQ